MVIKNALVFTEEGKFVEKDVYVDGERIADTVSDSDVIDGTGCYLVPGLMDIHFHGCMGHDFCDATPEALDAMAEYELKNGITSICPASMTLSEESLVHICENAKDYRDSWTPGTKARLCGINLEGPFIAMSKKGAQNPKYVTPPNIDMFQHLIDAGDGLVKLTTIAPETEGAMDFIRHFSKEIRISIGHTDCDYDTAKEAFLAGASHITHLFNAMPPFTHRKPALIGAGFDTEKVTPEIICDGIHIDPSSVRVAFSIFGDDRLILISDSMMATGMENGDYSLGGLAVKVTGRLATLEDGTIAGSATNLMDCVRTAVQKMEIPLESAIKCASINPAKAIGEDKEYGSIKVGKYADLLLLDKDDLALKKVISHGVVVS